MNQIKELAQAIDDLIELCNQLVAHNGPIYRSGKGFATLYNKLDDLIKGHDLQKSEFTEALSFLINRSTFLNNVELNMIIAALFDLRTERCKYHIDKIFISHSEKDKVIVQSFVELLESVGMTNKHIFCSSVNGYGIPIDQNIYDYLKEHFSKQNIYVLMMLSNNYYTSPASLNEMGAAWATSKDYLAILTSGFDFTQIKGAINPQRIAMRIDDKNRLDELYNKFSSAFDLPTLDQTEWNTKRDEFILKIDTTV
jgi:hypothetical protein